MIRRMIGKMAEKMMKIDSEKKESLINRNLT